MIPEGPGENLRSMMLRKISLAEVEWSINQSINLMESCVHYAATTYLINWRDLFETKNCQTFFLFYFFKFFLHGKLLGKLWNFDSHHFPINMLYIYFYFMIILCFHIFSFICLYGQFINVDKFYYSKLRR